MDLIDQTLSGTNQICLTDSLNASLLKLKLEMTANTVIPSSNDVIIYVDKNDSSNPSTDRKQYVFNLNSSLKYCNQVGDELLQQLKVVNNDIVLEAIVNRKVGTNESGNYILDSTINEDLENIQITLFEGTNYIYTNYENAYITLIYPKDNEENKVFLNSLIYYNNKLNTSNDFSLDDLYFKDAFTKTEEKLNLEVNNANIDCLTSKNNKFSLDSEGNLIVNSITTNVNSETPTIDNATICNLIYPVGSLYISINNTNPTALFGGSWERINGYYLYAGTGGNTAGSNNSGTPSNNNTGPTTLTIAQMPSHTHVQNAHSHTENPNCWINDEAHYDTRLKCTSGYYAGAALATYYTGSTTAVNQNTGGGQSHTHTLNSHIHAVAPLRYEVYMWKRTA